MAYPQLEELTSRKREKVALFLTAENMAGLLAIGLPAYIATTGTTFWLRILILLAAAVLGVVITSEINGMACYERVLWWVRGRLRRQLAGGALRPAEFTAAPVVQGDRAMPLGGPIRRARARASSPADSPRLAGVVRTATVPRYRVAEPVTVRGREPGETPASGSNGLGSPEDAADAVSVEDGDPHRF